MNDEKYQKYDLKFLTISIIISTLLITIIYNFNLDYYLKAFIIPTIIVLINYIINIKYNKLENNKHSYLLLIPIFLILINAFIFNVDTSNKFLNVIIISLLITFFLLSLLNKKEIINKNFIILFIEDIPSKLFTNLDRLKELKLKNNNKKIIQIIVGILIGIPICILLLNLLTTADSYFEYFIQDTINKIFNNIDIEFLIKNIFIIIVSFILSFSLFINYMIKRKNEIKENKLIDIPNTIVSTILILINLVFCLFIVSEISKLTTNFLHIPIKYTYASYAREGFFQLLFITSINGIITLSLLYKTKLKESKLIKTLLLILIIFSIILIFNSYYRMILYINAYTFTILRLQVILFLLLELILFILLIKEIISKLNNPFKKIIVLSLIFYIINLYLCNQVIVDFINKLIS